MASPQFLHLLDQLWKTAERRRLPWQPIRQYASGGRCDFRIALGEGIVRIETNDADERTPDARYTAYLTTRDGLLIDDLVARINESDYYPMLREIYHQALVAAFDLSRMVDGMQEDLESGKTLELPKERFNEDDVPF
ncbi:MAG TPA: hypothetical protein VG324_05820 [Blastocatellia bacterium]|nr:hypothetical protein [Blastocatellia bacterium]